jgi:hypothetical protein
VGFSVILVAKVTRQSMKSNYPERERTILKGVSSSVTHKHATNKPDLLKIVGLREHFVS